MSVRLESVKVLHEVECASVKGSRGRQWDQEEVMRLKGMLFEWFGFGEFWGVVG